jgi:anti-anti-sigma factor
MELSIEVLDGFQLVRIRGELDTFAAQTLRERLNLLRSTDRYVVDLADLSFIDSAGLNALFTVGRSAKKVGAAVVVVAPSSSPVRRVLDLVLLSQVTPVCESLDAATASLLRIEAA